MSIEAGDLILVAVFTGIGAGIGNPIGQLIFDRFIKRNVERLVEFDARKLVDFAEELSKRDSLRLLDKSNVDAFAENKKQEE